MTLCAAHRESVTCIYYTRNWKRDAQYAHAVRQNEVNTNGAVSPKLFQLVEVKYHRYLELNSRM